MSMFRSQFGCSNLTSCMNIQKPELTSTATSATIIAASSHQPRIINGRRPPPSSSHFFDSLAMPRATSNSSSSLSSSQYSSPLTRTIKICVSPLPAFTSPVAVKQRLLCCEQPTGPAASAHHHQEEQPEAADYHHRQQQHKQQRQQQKLLSSSQKTGCCSSSSIVVEKTSTKAEKEFGGVEGGEAEVKTKMMPPGEHQDCAADNKMVRPKNVLVTGGCGFIGSNFINFIFDKWPEANFINLDKLAHGTSPENVLPEIRTSSGRYVFVHGSLLDQSLVKTLLARHQIDTVIHFAAITHVDESYTDRIGTIQENVMATTTLLEAINAGGKQLKRFVHISTDEVYGDSVDDVAPKKEDSPLNPTNPYAASKAACEVIVRSYHHSYKLPYVMVRMNNVYGPRQAYSKLIPKFTRLALEGRPYPLMGDGMHTRSWMFVDDCAEAIRRVTEFGRVGQTYNIGTEFEKCNLHLTEMLHEKVQKLMAREATKIAFKPIPDRPYHDRRYHIDFSKIRNELDWTCVVPFEEGLARTLDYYVKEYQKEQREIIERERPLG